jgi:predicted acyl esterase
MIRLILILFFLSISISLADYWEVQIPTCVEDESKKYLKADFYSTDTTIRKPTLLVQTPYNRKLYRPKWGRRLEPENMIPFIDSNNYNYIIVDWRGFYDNKDKDIAQYDRGLDGYDIVEWIAQQSWSDGQIGTLGGSALGMIQFLTARHQPPHLVCAAPWIKNYQTSYHNYYYGGVLRYQHVLSLSGLGFGITYESITKFYLNSEIWKNQAENTEYSSEFNVPMFIVTGWFDHFPGAILREFDKICENSYKDVRDEHKLMIGPWTHGGIGQLEQGDLEYPEAVAKPQIELKRFFDYYLLGAKNGWPLEAKVKYFDTGSLKWNESDTTLFTNYYQVGYYLGADNTISNDYPTYNSEFSFTYDPKDPSPTIGGSAFNPFDENVINGPADMRKVLERNDNITFVSDIWWEDLIIKDRCLVELFVSSDREDTDIAVRLCDVHPNGKWYILTQGIRRMRFRNTYESEELMTPDRIYPVTIITEPLYHTIAKGHKLGIIITSSNYPMFDLNLNNGGELYKSGDTLVATNKVHIGTNHPSNLRFSFDLPSDVIESSEEEGFNIYPNPSSDYLYIQTKQEGDALVELYSLIGVKLLEEKEYALTKPVKININSFENGIYIVKLSQNNETYSKKIVILR